MDEEAIWLRHLQTAQEFAADLASRAASSAELPFGNAEEARQALEIFEDVEAIADYIWIEGEYFQYSYSDIIVCLPSNVRSGPYRNISILQLIVADWLEEQGISVCISDYPFHMMVSYCCLVAEIWREIPLGTPAALFDEVVLLGEMTASLTIKILEYALKNLDSGCLVRSCVESLRVSCSRDYDVFARNLTKSPIFTFSTTWLLAVGPDGRLEHPDIHPSPRRCIRQYFSSQIDFRNGGLSTVISQLQSLQVWNEDWLVTGIFCINHGYYDAYWRLRHGMPWATNAGVLGADLHMPCQQLRTIRRRGAQQANRPYRIPLQDVLTELLLHTTAQVLLQLQHLCGNHTAFLLVELAGNSESVELSANGKDLPARLLPIVDNPYRTPPLCRQIQKKAKLRETPKDLFGAAIGATSRFYTVIPSQQRKLKAE